MLLKGLYFCLHRGCDLKRVGRVLEAFLKLVQRTAVVPHISFHFVWDDSCERAVHPLMVLLLKLSRRFIQPQIWKQAVLNRLELWVLRDGPAKGLLLLVEASDLMEKMEPYYYYY